ncbi:MAG: hypothetical protein R8M46_07185 [Ghiorsea sp.]
MNRIFALAKITFLNGLRRNAVWGLCLFALMFEMFGMLFMDLFGRDLGRVISDFQFSIMWIAGMLFILFYAIQAIAWDDDHRAIDSILARPISRTEYVLGTMLGLTILLLCFEALLGITAYIQISWVKSMIEEVAFPIFSKTHYWVTWFGLQFILMGVLSVAMLISSTIRGAFPVMLMALAYNLICSGLPVVRESLKQKTNEVSQSLEQLLQGLSMIFPDYSMLDFKDSVVSLNSLENIMGMPVWMPISLIGLYMVVVVFLSCFIYHRRDIL